MKIIDGYLKARTILDRSNVSAQPVISDNLKQRLSRMFGTTDPEQVVRYIINEVRTKGDGAIFELTQKIDRIDLKTLEITKDEIASAYDKVSDELIGALETAAGRIRDFHTRQKRNMCRETSLEGLGQMVRPLARVGAYAPGGTAWYPSTVLMTAVPARVAGVKEIFLTTPPGPDGKIPAPTLVAADIAEVDRVFAVGGAQAIAALAYGTESIPRVDKICGPGNIFVVLAKKLVYGTVAIDGLQGPSEIIVIADEKADPAYCAADLLAQAEHDVMAVPLLITVSARIAAAVDAELAKQLKSLARKNIVEQSLGHGIIAIVSQLAQAFELANLYAPEHLELMIENAETYLPEIKNAGCVFTGPLSAVVLGDYVAGPSHVLPTGGTARFSSPLNVMDFVKLINTIHLNQESLTGLTETAAVIAASEGLEAHARAAEKRGEGDRKIAI